LGAKVHIEVFDFPSDVGAFCNVEARERAWFRPII
jgi:hypothetical protein